MDYIISEIIPKDGIMKDIHKEILGRKCYIIELEKGKSSLIKYFSGYSSGYHRLITSIVRDVEFSNDEKSVIIETTNTVYHLVESSCDGEDVGEQI